MKFLVISDIHGATDKVEQLKEKFSQADAVLFAGDFTKFNEPDTGIPALEKLYRMHETIFAVRGNCDQPEILEEMEKRDISVEKVLASIDGLVIAGSGGGSKFTGVTPFERTEKELIGDFKIITDEDATDWNNLIAVMHNPPQNTKCDTITTGAHVGSLALREFIETYNPLAVVTGHIHESVGVDKIGETVIINPGALMEGKYAWLTVSKKDGRWVVDSAELCNL